MRPNIFKGKVFESDTSVSVAGEIQRVVVVGVKLEQHSKELLTWTLMKVAQPGDRVVALHVLHASSVCTEEQSSLVSLIKTFDSVLAVYEGFCHLKQVDLKLKVVRGSSVRKVLIREAKLYGDATVIVGTSKQHFPVVSPLSVARHCARKLPRNISVFAVDNGKIVYRRKASGSDSGVRKLSLDSIDSSREDQMALTAVSSIVKEDGAGLQNRRGRKRHAIIWRYLGCVPKSSWGNYTSDLQEEPCINVSVKSSLAMVPFQIPEVVSWEEELGMDQVYENKQGWALIRRVFAPKEKKLDKASSGKNSIAGRFSRWRTQHSTITVHPDEKHIEYTQKDDQLSDLGGESSVIVPVVGYESSPPCSPVHGVNDFAEEMKSFHAKYSSMCRLFTYRELISATSGFVPGSIIGKGGSSHVFQGQLSDGKELAVKILKPSESVLKEFIAEIEIITSISHKNIVSLFGFCFEDESPILVYDLLPRGSLEENLHGYKKDATAFCLAERYKVALGVAEALDYLHNESSLPIIHRDIKSSNILLAEDFDPQLADFGFATWTSSASTFTDCTDVAGTFGYMAPEYFMHGKVTEKIDVYAFGVVLLELLSGRKPIDNTKPKGQESLVIWATPILKDGKTSDLIDASLGSDYDHDLVERMALAANLCLKRNPLLRSKINIILKLLQGDSDVAKWARLQLHCNTSDIDVLDEETSPKDIQSHLNVAFLDLEDDALSVTSTEPNVSIEDYLQGRWSRWPSFD